MKAPELVVSATPHIHSGNSVRKMMLSIIIALLPAVGMGYYLYGFAALKVIAISVISAVAWEAIFQKMMGREITVSDLSGAASGLIFAMLLPPTLPWWIIIIGTLLLILLGKEIYGGLGCNPFNGVLVAYVALQLSYPQQMIAWAIPEGDLMTEFPPLQVLRDEGVSSLAMYFTNKDLLLGIPIIGAIGEVSKVALLLGGIFLIIRRTISWYIPASFLLGMVIFSGIFWLSDAEQYASPVFHLLAGGGFLAAFFLATDPITSPVTKPGMIIYGLLCGVLAMTIRMWSQWIDGAYFAIFIISMLTPLLDKIKPRVYGRVKASVSS